MAHRTIMIIDEAADHRDLLGHLLRAVGYRVLEAAPDAAALDQARRERPDLILASLSLPGQPGWEIAQQLRAQPALAQTPILGATVYNTLLTTSRIRASGCVDCLNKPFDLDHLLDRIRLLLPEAPRSVMAA